ncbi:MAG: class I SAM-dependent methyltransferase [Verrucomicrobiota bacterium]|nr:class I SAM-dependent methyltransferase [Verrucomicrobiota bacterium]
MANQSLSVVGPLREYMLRVGVREPDVLSKLRAETYAMEWAIMQIAPEQGAFMAQMVRAMGATRILEVGTFTGYSSLVMALALPSNGQLITCDVSKEWTDIARRYWDQAGQDKKIDLRLGPGVESLDALVKSEPSSFDLMFIDADKTSYDAYYELGLKLVRAGGLILIDNVLWGGAVADPLDQAPDTVALRALNEKILNDTRVEVSMIPVGDGITLAWKK